MRRPRLEPLGHIALLLAALLACGGGGGEGAKPGPAPISAADVCTKLVAAKVARTCVEGGATADVVGIVHQTHFAVVGVPNYEGWIRQYGTAEKYKEWARNETDRYKTRGEHEVGGVPADEYPELSVLSPATRMIIDWAPPTSVPFTETTEIDRWEACRSNKTVATCAKSQPDFYNATKALYEATLRVVGSPVPVIPPSPPPPSHPAPANVPPPAAAPPPHRPPSPPRRHP